jgi:colanic acid/amylovoran biosynthesis protein
MFRFVPNVVFTCDTALLIPKLERKTVPDGRTIGFTIRSWFDNDERQNFFEESVANALATFVGESGYAVMPIVQVDAPSYGESDREPAERVCARLQTQGVQTLPIKVVGTVPEALNVYGSLVLLLGMRMHSNILAVTQGVPFVAISYEHKTLGIARMLDVDHYCLSVNEVNAENLLELLRELSANRAAVVGRTAHALAKLHRKCKAYWFKILEQHALR